ncbi:uncharacterized protein LOC143213316 [Lasioglossum baleicum]|uniref:uncharacterized protein LOC143213316 n=1 Tax=Lasioglossum baleicum TaxID=434251 RepID=UPI003FCD2F6A
MSSSALGAVYTILGNSTAGFRAVLDDFLQHRIYALTSIEKAKAVTTAQKSRSSSARSHATLQKRCILCTADHYLGACTQYLSKTPDQRKQLVTQHRRYCNCLGNHPRKTCRSTKRCTKYAPRHHTSLHEASTVTSASSSSSESAPTDESSSATVHHVVPISPKETALVNVISTNGDSFRGFLHQGVHLPTVASFTAACLPIYGIRADHNVTTRGVSTFVISSLTETYNCEVNAFILPERTHSTPTVANPHARWSHIQGLKLADPSYLDSQPIDIVIGVDVYSRIQSTNSPSLVGHPRSCIRRSLQLPVRRRPGPLRAAVEILGPGGAEHSARSDADRLRASM